MPLHPTLQLYQQFIDTIILINEEMLKRCTGDHGKKVFEQLCKINQTSFKHDIENSQLLLDSIVNQQKQLSELLNRFKGGGNRAPQGAFSFSHDSRFSDGAWQENPFFMFIKQSYILFSEFVMAMTETLPLSIEEKKKLRFYTKFLVDAVSPTNFLMTNPEVIRLAVETKGQSLVKGLENLNADMEKGAVSVTDDSAFKVGKNVAITPGAVVYENDIMQIIEYAPASKTVFERPMLIIPPCINKFYALDLQPENSFVKFCLDQGHTVFMISWVNPDGQYAALGWDDYIEKGVLRAISVTNELAGSKKLNAVSWCIGGTFLATALAVLHGRKKPIAVASATFLTTLLDYSEAGDLGLFVDEASTQGMVAYTEKIGVLPGKDLALTFSLLKANELIWSSVINNYLKGEKPAPCDLLYWNNDATNLPARMYNFYLRNMYLENNLVEPGRLTVCNVPIDLGRIKTPCCFFSAIDDHIAPWESTFLSTELLSGPREFILGASGHVAGVINPPARNKKSYWKGGEFGNGASHWLKTAKNRSGSWWLHWQEWVKNLAGEKITAPKQLGNRAYPIIEDAPGRYVLKRI